MAIKKINRNERFMHYKMGKKDIKYETYFMPISFHNMGLKFRRCWMVQFTP